jgi:hypothetical protein
MSLALRIFITLTCTGIILVLDTFTARNLCHQFESGSYPGITGRITNSEIRTHHSSKGGTSYSAYVSYTYQVGQQLLYGDRQRYTVGFLSSNYGAARRIVANYPPGSIQTIFYNPHNPWDSLLGAGLTGQDFSSLLFLTPFNMFLIGLWASVSDWLRERWFKPPAGGVTVIAEGSLVRIRLPQTNALWWGLGTTGALGLISVFLLSSGLRPDASVVFAVSALGIAFLAGVTVYGFLRLKAQSGEYDLIIDQSARTLSLPPTYGRNERLAADTSTINHIRVKKVEHRSSKGNISYTYAPTLCMSTSGFSGQKLADWSDQMKAEDFSRWLSAQLNVPVELSPED